MSCWTCCHATRSATDSPDGRRDLLSRRPARGGGSSRLLFDLRPYLTERLIDGGILLGFYHRQLEEAVAEADQANHRRLTRHQELAGYFAAQPLHWVTGTEVTPNLRKLAELPYQQAHGTSPGARATRTDRNVCDLDFIDTKCSAGHTYDLLADYERARVHAAETGEYASFVNKHAQRLASCGTSGGEAGHRYQLGPVFRTDDDRGYVGSRSGLAECGWWTRAGGGRFSLPPGSLAGGAFGINGTDHLLGVAEWETPSLSTWMARRTCRCHGSRATLPGWQGAPTEDSGWRAHEEPFTISRATAAVIRSGRVRPR